MTSLNVRTCLADFAAGRGYPTGMARRGVPKEPPLWYLREWMASKGIKKQADMMRLTGWSKATMSQLYNGTQDFSPKLLKEAAHALKVEPYQLLMAPDAANALMELRRDALRVVASSEPLGSTGTEG